MLRLLLKGAQYIHCPLKLHRVDCAKRVAAMIGDYLEHSGDNSGA